MLRQVADGVWVRQSGWMWTNTIVLRGVDGGPVPEEIIEHQAHGRPSQSNLEQARAG